MPLKKWFHTTSLLLKEEWSGVGWVSHPLAFIPSRATGRKEVVCGCVLSVTIYPSKGWVIFTVAVAGGSGGE